MALKLVNGSLVDADTGEVPTMPEMTDAPDITFIANDLPDEPVQLGAIVCRNCSNTFYREPGSRGPNPKTCPDCKASGSMIKPQGRGRQTTGAFPGEAALRVALIDRYLWLSMVAIVFGKAELVTSIRDHAEKCADADIAYARSNITFRKWLQGTVEKSAAAGIVAAHAAMFSPVITPIFGPTFGRLLSIGGGNKATAPPRPPQAPQEHTRAQPPRVNPFARGGSGQGSRPGQTPPPVQPPVETVGDFIPDEFFPAEHEGQPGKTPESINAQDMFGMPGT